MDYIEVTVYTTSEGCDIVTGALSIAFPALSNFVIEDGADFTAFLSENSPRWDYVDESLLPLKEAEPRVKFYLADNAQGRELLEAVPPFLATLGDELGRLTVETKVVRESDWENNWKAYFKPFPVGERFVIKPSWEELTDSGGRIVLEIDPGSSFGTGTHATTRLCIGALEERVSPGARVLDLGCGSGILSLAALLLGAEGITAVDVDENAVRIARENIEKNRFSDRARFFTGDVTADEALLERLTGPASGAGPAFGAGPASGGPYDVVAANIVADVLIAMAPLFPRLMKENAFLVVSGIIGERADEVRLALEARGLSTLSRREEEDWVCLTLQKA